MTANRPYSSGGSSTGGGVKAGVTEAKAESKKGKELPKMGGEGVSLPTLSARILLVGGVLPARGSLPKGSGARLLLPRSFGRIGAGRLPADPSLRAGK